MILHIMSRCCTLANPSTDPVILHAQKLKLNELHLTTASMPVPAADHVCTSKISVAYDRYHDVVDKLPLGFCIKVIIPAEPDGSKSRPIKPALDPIAKAIYDHVITSSCAVAVIDSSLGPGPDMDFIRAATRALGRNRTVIFQVHTGQGGRVSPAAHQDDGSDLCHMRYVDPEHILAIMANSTAHVLTGCSLGWNAAMLSQSDLVAYPDPWTPGLQFKVKPQWIKVKCCWSYSRYFDHAYYINLDRRADRRSHMERQLERFNIAATRVPAIDGKSIGWKPEYGVMSEYWNHGAFAYCISYRTAIIDAIRKGYDNVLIMDDDCVLQDNLWKVLDNCWSILPEEWHMLYLAANHGSPQLGIVPVESIGNPEDVNGCLYRLRGSMGSHAIIINKSCFNTILNYLSSPYAPLDMFFGMYQKFFPCYITYPGLATQLSGVSDIIGKDIDYAKDWGVDYVHHIKK
jgi:hypothetical protein